MPDDRTVSFPRWKDSLNIAGQNDLWSESVQTMQPRNRSSRSPCNHPNGRKLAPWTHRTGAAEIYFSRPKADLNLFFAGLAWLLSAIVHSFLERQQQKLKSSSEKFASAPYLYFSGHTIEPKVRLHRLFKLRIEKGRQAGLLGLCSATPLTKNRLVFLSLQTGKMHQDKPKKQIHKCRVNSTRFYKRGIIGILP